MTFDDVAGYEDQIRELHNALLSPLYNSGLQSSIPILTAPTGVLLYGPPGCGKTMISKCVAKSANARFINLSLSLLMDKYFGESEKIVAATFSLARKIRPCIIFMDEIDAVLRNRSLLTSDSTSCLKAQLLSLWDGLMADQLHSQVVVMGATNRPEDIDPAFLRRLSLKVCIDLPTEQQRFQILCKYLEPKHIGRVMTIEREKETVLNLASFTEGFSGSALRDLIRTTLATVVQRVEEDPSKRRGSVVPLTLDDFWPAIERQSEWKC